MAATAGTAAIVPRRFQGRINPVRAGAIALADHRDRDLAGVHASRCRGSDPFEFNAVFQTVEQPAARLAGAHRRRQRRQGRRRSSARRTPTSSRSRWRWTRRGCRSTRTRRSKIRSRIFLEGNFFVDLTPGTPSADKVGDGDTIPVTQTSTPVQLDQLLTALQTQRPRVPAGPAEGPRRRAHAQADRRRRRRPGPGRAGRVRGQVAERLAQLRAGVARRARPRSTRRCSAPSRTTSRKLIAGLDKVDDRARHQRGAAEGLHHELQPLLRDLRRGADEPDRGDRRCWGRPLENARNVARRA